MNIILLISIILELVISALFLKASIKDKRYLYGLVVTFAIYVFYDIARLFSFNISGSFLTGIFFVATLSALYSAWMIAR